MLLNLFYKSAVFTWKAIAPLIVKADSDSNDFDDELEPENLQLYEEKNTHGKITEVNKAERYGMIDGTIYFSFDHVYGSKHPKIGDTVSAKISRSRPEHSWIAENVNLIDELWDENENEQKNDKPVFHSDTSNFNAQNAKERAIISTVKIVESGHVTCCDGTTFNLKDMDYDFVPWVGDVLCISVLVDKDDEEEKQILGFKPTRKSDIDGEVTCCRADGGVIDDQIWFAYSVCNNNYRPKRGDKVKVEAVERNPRQNQGKYVWRAIFVAAKQLGKTDYGNSNPKNQAPKMKLPVQNSFIQELLKNKNDVIITDNLTFQKVELFKTSYLSVWINNVSAENRKLVNCRLRKSLEDNCQFTIAKPMLYGDSSLPENCDFEDKSLVIPNGGKAYINLICNATQIGKSRHLIFFEFENFSIGRYIEVEVTDKLLENLMPTVPFRKLKQKDDSKSQKELFEKCSGATLISGGILFKPPNNVPVKLLHYPVPNKLWEAILDNDEEAVFTLLPTLSAQLSPKNYVDKFSALLHLEEIQMSLDMRRYDIKDVCLTTAGEFLKLAVPGLAEGRPSLLLGDKVILTTPGEEDTGPAYAGYIHDVLHNEVLLKFNPIFHQKFNGESFNVAFQFSRTPLRRCHQAINQIVHIDKEILFPTKVEAKPPVISVATNQEPSKNEILSEIFKDNIMNENNNSSSVMNWFNPTLNERQKTAVKRIVENQARPLPYCVFGPPGTGKTITIVESILQVFHLIKSSRILVVTPSNSAADLIVERLHDSAKVTNADLVRLNGFSRSRCDDSNTQNIKQYCKTIDDIENVAYYRIIVATCTTIGSLYTLGLNVKHFSHAFIDEAGQATEPECLVAIGLVAIGKGQVVLAGDHMQLGPVLRSSYAKTFGLELSLLERLMERVPYQRDETKFCDHGNFDPLLVTKLTKNYRSHDSILSIYSTLFYHDELISLANQSVVTVFDSWSSLPKSNFPILFDGVRGENYREDTSPSWFNPVEVVQVIRYIRSLYDFGIYPEDIGVITPYRKQGEKIRELMSSVNLEPCKVGSVEEFQGREYLVIIISTVRTCPDLLDYDIKHSLGFLRNPKRFNVSVSRAIALLIVIGDPYLLANDEYWGFLLEYCVENKGYRGTEYH